MISLINKDCLNVMKGMGEEIDLTVTSPPYDDLRTYKDCQWNEEIWKKILKELFRITKKGGVVVWIVGDKTENYSESGTSFKQALYAKYIGFCLYDTMIYQKENTPPYGESRYRQSFEYMFVFSKGKPKTFNPIFEKTLLKGVRNSGCTKRLKDGSTKKRKTKEVKEEKIKGNIWKYQVGFQKTTKDVFAYKHPAMFPEQLAKDCIYSWSNKGDLVFDPMMGSGTVGKMAMLMERNFIGVEISKEYFKIAQNRIKLNKTLFHTIG